MNPDVDAYISRSRTWRDEMSELRLVLLGCGLTEAIKWGKPCYSHEGKNIAILQEMKEFLALMFFKGALLEDPAGVLEEQGPNSRSALRIRFTSVDDVARLSDTVAAYIDEAVAVEESGLASRTGTGPRPGGRTPAATRRRPGAADGLRGAHARSAAGVQPDHRRCEAGVDPSGASRQVRAEDPRRQGSARPMNCRPDNSEQVTHIISVTPPRQDGWHGDRGSSRAGRAHRRRARR